MTPQLYQPQSMMVLTDLNLALGSNRFAFTPGFSPWCLLSDLKPRAFSVVEAGKHGISAPEALKPGNPESDSDSAPQ